MYLRGPPNPIPTLGETWTQPALPADPLLAHAMACVVSRCAA